jgi:cell division protease FtsH
MLKEPSTYSAAGARLPAGVLMCGPPGTGKTLLARVMAAQADVPFFYCSGSDFVELFVGRGAARMRALFKEAAASAPCLIFVDELDALGKQRSMRIGGSNDEVEQTLNQMLACMDGLETSNNGVVVMGATNRYDILDPALTRPGRFDRVVRISLPDERGRLDILRVHTRKLKLAPDVNLQLIADNTPTYSGAELAALANEAAIRAVRRSTDEVRQSDFVAAINTFNEGRRRLPSIETLAEGLKPAWWPKDKSP